MAAGFLLVVRVMMHGLLVLLAMSAPLAFATLATPMSQHFFWKWAGMLGGLLIVHVLQVMLMVAAGGMLGRVASTAAPDTRDLTTGVVAMALLGTAGVLPPSPG